MSWKVGDFCVANHFGHWSNSEIRDIGTSLATVAFIDGNDVADVPISSLKQFGPFVVNQKGELMAADDKQHYHGQWKVGRLKRDWNKVESGTLKRNEGGDPVPLKYTNQTQQTKKIRKI